MDKEIAARGVVHEDELISLDRAARCVGRSPLTLAAWASERRQAGSPPLHTLLVADERHTTLRWVRAYLETGVPVRPTLELESLIVRLADDPTFWSYVLSPWMADEGLDGVGACRGLGISRPLDIMLLAGLSCPFPGSPYWEALVAFSGRYAHADVARLRAVLVRYKRLPESSSMLPLQEDAIHYGDHAFMARPLVRWQILHDRDDRALGAYLAMPSGRLGLLAYDRRPEPDAVDYAEDVRFLSRQHGCDAAHLDSLLREGTIEGGRGRAKTAYRSTGPAQPAIRDHTRTVLGASHGR